MKNVTPSRSSALLMAALAFPSLAHAHSGQPFVFDCASGLAHPLHGWDHAAAMIAVGVWAAQLGGRSRWLMPATFITVMSCAAALSSRGFILPGVEPVIVTSVLALGLLIAAAARLPLAASVTLVALFAAAHGAAHGNEIPASADAFSYATGLVIATATLHALGVLAGHVARRTSRILPRALGTACAAIGVTLLIS